MNRDRILTAAKWVLRLLVAVNWAAGLLFVGVLVVTFLGGDRLLAGLERNFPDADAAQVLAGIRLIMVICVAAVVPVHAIFAALLRMLATVETGDPFIADNAARLQRIGWALLAVQLLDLAFGLAVAWTGEEIPVASGWEPSIAGWISVLLVFVLARVFAQGARMRDELAMTV